jgi:hypothetical protein
MGWLWVLVLQLFSLQLWQTSPSLTGGIESLSNDAFAIVQFDSRSLKNYWLTAAEWNNAYCMKHGHHFLYYTLEGICHYKDEKLADAWCKVKAMINAMEDYPNIHVFYYMDSDAVIDQQFAHLSLKTISMTMKNKLHWEETIKPIIFNQDGPCWWCSLIMKIGYTMCLNAGTVVYYRHIYSEKILWEWWDASMDSYETNPIKRLI